MNISDPELVGGLALSGSILFGSSIGSGGVTSGGAVNHGTIVAEADGGLLEGSGDGAHSHDGEPELNGTGSEKVTNIKFHIPVLVFSNVRVP